MKILLWKYREVISEINHYGMASKWGYREIPAEMPLTASFLKGKGYDVDCLDVEHENDLPNRQYDLMVFWICVFCIDTYVKKLKLVKKRYPGVKVAVVLNDAFGSFEAEFLSHNKFIDIVIRRYQREITLAHLIENQLEPSRLPSGIVYQEADKVIDKGMCPLNSYAHLKTCKNELAQLNLNEYDSSIVLVQHGCPGKCTFCLVGRQKPVYRNIDDVISEIKVISRSMGQVKLVLIAPVFLYDISWVKEFCHKIIAMQISVLWETDIRADFKHTNENSETLALMRKAGCQKLYIGAETYDQEAMERIGKRYDIKNVIATSEFLTQMGFDVVHQLLIGMPNDSDTTYMTTYKTMKDFPLSINHNIQILRPHPGTEVRKQAERLGLIPKDQDDYTLLQNYVDSAVMGTGKLTKSQVNAWYKAFKYLYYYRRIKRRIETMNATLSIDLPKLAFANMATRFFLRIRNLV